MNLQCGSKELTGKIRKRKAPILEGEDGSGIPRRRDAGLKRAKREGGLPHFLEEQALQRSQVAAPLFLDATEVAIQEAHDPRPLVSNLIYIYLSLYII